MLPKSLKSVIRSLVVTESLKVYMMAIYLLLQYDRKKTNQPTNRKKPFSLLFPPFNRPYNARSKKGSRGTIVSHCINHGNIKTLLASHYYTKYSLALWKMVSNNCVWMRVLFFFHIAIWERKNVEDTLKKNINKVASTNCHQMVSSYLHRSHIL